jgi:CheY-like chemotaxis protein
MSPVRSAARQHDSSVATVPSVVVIDPRFDIYRELVAAARAGSLDLHLRSTGAEAIRLNRNLKVDAWLIASELDDMSGHDLVELLKGEAGGAPVAMVLDAAEGRRRAIESTAATESGADAALSHPISLADLERLLELPSEERALEFSASDRAKAFVTVPVGLGAAVIAIAVLMIG